MKEQNETMMEMIKDSRIKRSEKENRLMLAKWIVQFF